MMVNGRMGVQFNDEHAKITESIMASDQVSQLDQDICAKIVEVLGEISVCKPQKITRPAVHIGVDTSVSVPANSNDSSYTVSSADTLRSGKTQRGFVLEMVICLCGILERGTRRGSFSVQHVGCQ